MNSVHRPLGRTSLSCHPLGFGTYRTVDGNEEHELALRLYLSKGGNLIDTSANYGDGLSEKLVGTVLKDVPRDRVILVTKGGYMQGENLKLAKSRGFPEVVRYGPDLWHCIHPDFLETQLTASLERTGTDAIDVYLLHNPEYFVNHAARHDAIHDAVLDEYYRRIESAFAYLESQVDRGRIRTYGISSNTFGFHPRDRARTDLMRCLKAAEAVSTDHHFAVIQLPMNLFESGGALFEAHSGLTALQFCRSHNIGVLLNRPLNAFFGDRLYRLADWSRGGDLPDDFLDRQLHRLEESERSFQLLFGGDAFGERRESLTSYLKAIARDLPSKDQWEAVFYHYVIPPLRHWLQQNERQFGSRPEWTSWKETFVREVEDSLEHVDTFLAHASQPVSDRIRQQLYRSGYPPVDVPLSRIALHLLSRLDGVSSVLCGMRRRAYVEDAFAIDKLPDVDARRVLDQFQIQIGGV